MQASEIDTDKINLDLDLSTLDVKIDLSEFDIDASLMLLRVKKADPEEVADILERATVISTTNHGGMLAHHIKDPSLGEAVIVQGIGDGAILIRGS